MRIKDEAGKFISIDPVERLKNSYIVDPITGCWKYTGYIAPNGYGQIQVYGKTLRVHRFAYETFVGPLDTTLEICHSCNCKSCINPEHLRQDTRSSNAIDKSYVFAHADQKLTPEQVIEIKKELQNPYWGINTALANKYKVHNTVISQIKLGLRWSHLTID
jgi:hypothetical protein